MVENLLYQQQRQRILTRLCDTTLDKPIAKLVLGFNQLQYCFTLQSCYGHFVYKGQSDPHNLEPLPITESIDRVEYRIAYMAFCIENSKIGREFFHKLNKITALDPDNIQFCCAEWFWERQVNSYVLQVEPDRYKCRDRALLDYKEALAIEKIRNEFFLCLEVLLKKVTDSSSFMRISL